MKGFCTFINMENIKMMNKKTVASSFKLHLQHSMTLRTGSKDFEVTFILNVVFVLIINLNNVT
jgi:hypothetical protein